MLLTGYFEELMNTGVAHRIYFSQLGGMSGKCRGVGARSRHQLFLVNGAQAEWAKSGGDRKSTRLNSSHRTISYAVFCLKKKKKTEKKEMNKKEQKTKKQY